MHNDVQTGLRTLLFIVPALAWALAPAQGAAPSWEAAISGTNVVEAGASPAVFLSVTNRSDRPVEGRVAWSLQRNPQGAAPALPDARHGTDHAAGCRSWLEVNGGRIEDGSLTDGSPYTCHDEAVPKPGYTEAFHVVDLGVERAVSHLAWESGDANWLWKMDVAASVDGEAFSPVAGLQGVNMFKRWGAQALAVPSPFRARVLRLRYHKDGETLGFLRTPVSLSVYDGVADETFAPPAVGETVSTGTCALAVGPGVMGVTPVAGLPALDGGAFLLFARVEADGQRALLAQSLFVMPPRIESLSAASPFGLNGSSFEYFDVNRRLGVKWIRFENMKWQMSMPGPDRYAFDGSVAPWKVNHDDYVRQCRERGMDVLPYTFQTPKWLSTAPAGTTKNVAGYPPRDNRDYGEMMFQLAARYGAQRHPDGVLKTADHVSGLGQLGVFQLWNEPNLEGPSWAPWVGSMSAYFDLFRVGAEAVKRADPSARVSPAGLAGIELDTVAPLWRHTYADGKRALDFADLISVHYYSGRQPPETATIDRNANRGARPVPGDATYPEVLERLIDWRDEVAPGKPIWMTETGYDVGGPIGLSERDQAAKLPRVIMLALASGVERVFVYREKGSDPAQHAGAGLCRNDDSLRPVWFTYATLIRQFQGVKPGRAWRLAHPDPNVWVVAWERDGAPLLTAWAVAGEPALALPLGACSVVDAFGRRTRADAAGLRLGAFPVYIAQMEQPAALQPLLRDSRDREAARQETRRREASRRAYLFDFGSREYVGSLNLGSLRAYTAVLSADVFSDERGYGFEPAAMRDEVAAWVADRLRKDSTRIGRGQRFRFRITPGRYRLGLLATPVGTSSAAVTLRCGNVSEELSVAEAGADATTPVVRTLELGEPEVSLTASGYVNLQALELVAEDPS